MAIAEEINKTFSSVSQSRLPLNSEDLPAFLPAKPPPPIHVCEMYRELKKLNAKKSAGPDGLPGKLMKEFACELSIPVTDILNASLHEGYILQIFKDATVVPILKEMPATITKLRPISLTALLAKACELKVLYLNGSLRILKTQLTGTSMGALGAPLQLTV